MSDHITIEPAEGTWVVRAGGAVLGESSRALWLTEGSYAPVLYMPRADIAMAMFDRSQTTSRCRWKGLASYYSIVTKSGVIEDSAWSYENPMQQVAAIGGHLAFYPDRVTIERV